MRRADIFSQYNHIWGSRAFYADHQDVYIYLNHVVYFTTFGYRVYRDRPQPDITHTSSARPHAVPDGAHSQRTRSSL